MFRMVRFFLFFFPLILQASFFNWSEPLSVSLSVKGAAVKEAIEEMHPLIEKALQDYGVPGVAIGVLVDGQVIYTKGFGYRNIEKKLPVTPETLFPIGSCTKAFTTFLMGTLCDEGRVFWDQPVIDLCPEFRLQDLYATTHLTLRDLLTHRTGLPRHEFFSYNSKMSPEEMWSRLRYLQPSAGLRERYQYGNLMYFAAGVVMQSLAGKSWEQLIEERILKPLGMNSTQFSVEKTEKSSNFAFPYLEKNDQLQKIPFRNLSLIGPAGAMNSNVEDLTHWLQMHLASGVYQGRRLISPTTLQELHAPQVTIPGPPELEETHHYSYGLGWLIASYRGHYFVSHDGVSDGFTSLVGFFPEENVGIIVLTNKSMTPLPRFLSSAILDRVLGLPRRDWLKLGLDKLQKKNKGGGKGAGEPRRMGTFPSHSLEQYVGVYEHPGYGKLSVELVDGNLEVHYNDLVFVLDHWHYDVFNIGKERQEILIPHEGLKFTFHNDNLNGEVGELSVPFESAVDDIVFRKRSSENPLSYLRQFTGIYKLHGYTVEVALKNHSLFAIIPGWPNYELIPLSENEFNVKAMTGTRVRFILDSSKKVEEVRLIRSYGTVSAFPER